MSCYHKQVIVFKSKRLLVSHLLPTFLLVELNLQLDSHTFGFVMKILVF